MLAENNRLIELLALIDEVWVEAATSPGRGRPHYYAPKVMFKVYVVSLLKKCWERRGLWRYLQDHPEVMVGCGLKRLPDRRTLDRRLAEIASQAEVQIRQLGLVLVLEGITDSRTAASDGSAFKTPGPVWHKTDKAAGHIPTGLHGLDQEADWIQSSYHGWIYGYKAHVTISVSFATVRVVLDATVTGSASESVLLKNRLADLPAPLETLLLDAGYDDGDLIAHGEYLGLEMLVPLAKPIGKTTSLPRQARAAYLASPIGKARYRQRGSSIEPFFATLKDFFALHPLPVQGKAKAAAYILLALYAWNLIVLFNFIHDRPLGAVKSILDIL